MNPLQFKAGQKVHSWTVVAPFASQPGSKGRWWLCCCECGIARPVSAAALGNGHSKSCGCHRNRRHGLTGTKEHQAWKQMIARCENMRNKRYQIYGGRGIKVCSAWRRSFEKFLGDVGRAPAKEFQLDRIDNDGNYEPGNVRWTTRSRQARNRRDTVMLTINDLTLPLADWSERSGVKPDTIAARIKNGWNTEKAVFSKVR